MSRLARRFSIYSLDVEGRQVRLTEASALCDVIEALYSVRLDGLATDAVSKYLAELRSALRRLDLLLAVEPLDCPCDLMRLTNTATIIGGLSRSTRNTRMRLAECDTPFEYIRRVHRSMKLEIPLLHLQDLRTVRHAIDFARTARSELAGANSSDPQQ